MHLCSDPFFTGGPDAAAVVFNDLAHNRQSNAASTLRRISGRIRTVEPVKDIRQILCSNAFSIIFDLYLDEIPVILDTDIDNALFLVQIFHRITNDIVDHTLHLLCIGDHYHIFIYIVKISQFNTSGFHIQSYFFHTIPEIL